MDKDIIEGYDTKELIVSFSVKEFGWVQIYSATNKETNEDVYVFPNSRKEWMDVPVLSWAISSVNENIVKKYEREQHKKDMKNIMRQNTSSV